jgi:hypothetical protein
MPFCLKPLKAFDVKHQPILWFEFPATSVHVLARSASFRVGRGTPSFLSRFHIGRAECVELPLFYHPLPVSEGSGESMYSLLVLLLGNQCTAIVQQLSFSEPLMDGGQQCLRTFIICAVIFHGVRSIKVVLHTSQSTKFGTADITFHIWLYIILMQYLNLYYFCKSVSITWISKLPGIQLIFKTPNHIWYSFECSE